MPKLTAKVLANVEASIQAREAYARLKREEGLELSAEHAREDKIFRQRAGIKISLKMAEDAVRLLKRLGFTREDIIAGYHGSLKFSFRDHRMQLLILEALKAKRDQ